MSLSDAHHFRKMVAGACMIVAPILFLASAIVLPGLDDDAGAYLANAVDHPDQWYLQAMLGLAATVFLIPAALGLMHMLREREVALGHVGGALALVGVIGFAVLCAFDLVVWQMTKGGETTQMVALLDRVQNADGIMIPLSVAVLCFPVGMLVLSWGLLRAHAVRVEMAVMLAFAVVVMAVAWFAVSQTLLIIAAALLTVALGSIGFMVWREPDESWEHTPQLGGPRAAMS